MASSRSEWEPPRGPSRRVNSHHPLILEAADAIRLLPIVRTRDLEPVDAFHLMAIGKTGPKLTFHEGGLEPTRDWTRIEVVFNSRDQTEVNLYADLWGGRKGTLWLDDLELQEMPLVNILRREGCPLAVASADGKTIYQEGRDFEPVRDPKLGSVPYEGEYEFDHPGPRLRLTATSRIKESFEFFQGLKHPQIMAGYYDSDDNFGVWEKVSKGVTGVTGFMDTTWQNRYGDLEKYAKMLVK